uniref:CCHC-type domain-containing protein n=1 Tax=Ananas comosus var. bracteatus TaxID=296719 RepID=A0A6V7PR50_ANACO|nr:unnamed protein product [Ananas comosus var. bracteatus]
MDGAARAPPPQEAVHHTKDGRDLLRIFKELKQSVANDWGGAKPPVVEEDKDSLERKEKMQDLEQQLTTSSQQKTMGKKHDGDDGRITPGFEVQSKKRDDPRKKKVVKRVAWADEVGRALVESKSIYAEDEVTILGFGKSSKGVQRTGVNAPSQRGRVRSASLGSKGGIYSKPKGERINSLSPPIGSYKEALLRKPSPPPLLCNSQHNLNNARLFPRRLLSGSLVGRCFRCLASNNRIAECRDPVRCLSCRKLGHQASTCKSKVLRASNKMNKAYCQQGRTQPAKVYVLYTEEYSRRRELRHNAVLAGMIQPADLGPNSTRTITSTLARCNARSHRVTFHAWIRLINLPFECWTVARVVALVSGFGRFEKADATTKARAVDEANQDPPAPPHIDPNNGYDQSRDRGNSPWEDGENGSVEDTLGEDTGEIDEVRSVRIRAPRRSAEQRVVRRERAGAAYGRRSEGSTGSGGATL